MENGFRVTVFSTSYSKVGDKVGDRVGDTLTLNQNSIVKLILTDQHISATDLSKRIGISKRKIEENIRKLREAGILERVGAAKGGHWKIIADDK